LDDSDQDPQNPITTLAGYIARDTAWENFEREVEPIFTAHGVSVLHARHLENIDGEFQSWRRLKKHAFALRPVGSERFRCNLQTAGRRKQPEENYHALHVVLQFTY
jgi:hypothetical protein